MKRFRLAPAVLAVLVGLCALVFAGSAGAYHTKNATEGVDEGFNLIDPPYLGFDPMETSVPYLAWRGEEVRLVKCFDRTVLVRETGFNLNNPFATAEWQVMEWSGDQFNWPKFYDDLDQRTGHFTGFGDQSGRDCFAIDITSHKAGIATVKMSVDADDLVGENGETRNDNLIGEGDPVAKHQFVVIWMSLRRPILRCLEADTEVSPSGCPGAGPVTENPLDTNRLGALVKGDVPLTPQFATELGAQVPALNTSSIVLPDAWGALSQTSLASISHGLRISNDGNPLGFNNDVNDGVLDVRDSPTGSVVTRAFNEPRHTAGDFWDIHDSTGPLNSGVYAPDQPLTVPDFCPPPATTPANHNALCHVSQNPLSGLAACAGDNDPAPNSPAGNGRDTVDNCDSSEWGPFSRVFHDVSAEFGEPTIGPFTNTRPDETLLSDSQVNAHDAPMPAAVIIASIAPGPTGTPAVGGVGSLTAVDKHEVYNRGGTACTDPRSPHCVTNPFSGAYIPPVPTMERNPATVLRPPVTWTDDPDVGSGIVGSFANNFEGYLPVSYPQPGDDNAGLYHYWDIIEVTRQAAAGTLPAACLAQGFDPVGSDREQQEIVLYTDEHGEAQFQYNALDNFFPAAFTVDPQQFACVPNPLLGTASITATARYPFQPHTHVGVSSLPLEKRILSLFEKGVVCVPKTTDPQAALCVVFARDIAGDPIIDEEVCVGIGLVGAGSDVSMVQVLDPYDETRRLDRSACGILDNVTPDPSITDLFPAGTIPPGMPGAGGECGPTGTDLDDYGWLVLKVDGSGSLKATAKFEDENIERSCFFSIGPVGTPPGTPPPLTGAGSANANGVGGQSVVLPGGKVLADGVVVSGSGTRASGSSRLENQPSSANRPSAAKKRASIIFVRIVKPLKQGAVRSVILRVKSPNKTARITLKLIGPRGKVIGTVLRTVKTNRTVTVPNLRVPKAVTNVRVKLIA